MHNKVLYTLKNIQTYSTIILHKYFRIGQPLCLSQLISAFNPESNMPLEHVYLYATGVVVGAIYSTLHASLAFSSQLIGMKARVATSSLIFQKVINLSVIVIYI